MFTELKEITLKKNKGSYGAIPNQIENVNAETKIF